MNKLDVQLFAIISVPVLILGGIGFFSFRMYSDLQTLKTEVHTLADTSTSSAPLIKLGNAIVTNNFAGLCVVSGNQTLCKAAGSLDPSNGTLHLTDSQFEYFDGKEV